MAQMYGTDGKLLLDKLQVLTGIQLTPTDDIVDQLFREKHVANGACASIPAGDWRLWLKRYGQDWACFFLTRGDDREVSTVKELGARPGVERITFAQARRHYEADNTAGFEVGDRIATADMNGCGLLGLVARVDSRGCIVSVQVDPDGSCMDPQGLKWFKLQYRDDAFRWAWHNGSTRFAHYRNMLGVLALRQKKLGPALYAAGKNREGAPAPAAKANGPAAAPKGPAHAPSPSAPAAAQPAETPKRPHYPWKGLSAHRAFKVTTDDQAEMLWQKNVTRVATAPTQAIEDEVGVLLNAGYPENDICVTACRQELERRTLQQAIENLI